MSTSDLKEQITAKLEAAPPELLVKLLCEFLQRCRVQGLLSASETETETETPLLMSISDLKQQAAARLKAAPQELRVKLLRELLQRFREEELLSVLGSKTSAPMSTLEGRQAAAKLKAVPPQLRLKVLRELARRSRERKLSDSESKTPVK